MSTMNISLPDTLKSFVDEQVSQRGYGTSSEYVRELIRKDQDRLQLRGLLLLEPGAANLFFQLVTRRYERGSILVTSNRAVGEWGEVFGDAVVATAILDRLLHHSHVITIRGDSYRLRAKRKAGLVKPNPAAEQLPVRQP